jgi:predicted transglutaminase-like cysteine proteinase
VGAVVLWNARYRRVIATVLGGAAALALGGGAVAAQAQDDAAPLAPSAPLPPPEPCAAVHRTSPEFLAAFGAAPAEIANGAAEDSIAKVFTAPENKASPPAPGRILASGMLPTAHTSFDSQWRQVRDSGLDPACAAWLFHALPSGPRRAAIPAVNAWVNRHIRYSEEARDRWSEAAVTLSVRRGDCEDIAILKLQLLAALGVPLEDLYLTLARDLVRRKDHAVLVVRMDGALWVLDSSTDRLLDARQAHDYRPILSYSQERKWLHGR